MPLPTSIEYLKAFSRTNIDADLFAPCLRGVMYDKGFDLEGPRRACLARIFGKMFSQLCLRFHPTEVTGLGSNFISSADFLGASIFQEDRSLPPANRIGRYTGSPAQNRAVDQALSRSNYSLAEGRASFGFGAATQFTFGAGMEANLDSLHPNIKKTKIVVLGGGVSGVMLSYALIAKLGWDSSLVTIIERSENRGGIWEREDVVGLSRNNPKKLHYFGDYTLDAAPGPGKGVKTFIDGQIPDYHRFFRGSVIEVTPGDLNHKVLFQAHGKSGQEEVEVPIVVNTLGLGKPREISDANRIQSGTSLTYSGYRWQKKMPLQDFHKKSFVLIGLGNSTAEMLVQFESAMRAGYEVNYKVLTHYPLDAIYNPNDTVVEGGVAYRVFRDMSAPNLTRYTGDLPDTREAYVSALYNNRIIPNVRYWNRQGSDIVVRTGDILKGKKSNPADAQVLLADSLFTLIGYEHPPSVYQQLGINYRSGSGPMVDYDGEFQREISSQTHLWKPSNQTLSRGRVYPGYFGLGPIIETTENPNAVVIPGNLFRMGDLLFGIIMRAFEYQRRQDK